MVVDVESVVLIPPPTPLNDMPAFIEVSIAWVVDDESVTEVPDEIP